MTKRRDEESQLALFAEWQIGEPVSTPKLARRPDPLWDAVSLIWGEVANEVERARRNKAVANLREADVHPHEIELLAGAYRAKFPSSAFTVLAVSTRIGELRHYLRHGLPSGQDVEEQLRWARAMLETRGDS